MEEQINSKQPNQFLIPAAILIAGLFVAGALYFSGTGYSPVPVVNNGDIQPVAQAPEPTGSTDAVRPVTSEDHIKGNPDAPIKIVEYSDFDCPFCGRFHETMNQVMAQYGESGDVNWTYRHFPLDQIHPQARPLAIASECVAELGGNEKFWEFSNIMFGK
jgi:protein-disulfide isomerase